MGLIRKLEGDYAGAIDAYEQALQFEEDAFIYGLLAESYTLAGRYEDAIAAYEKQLAIDPDNYQAYLHLGNLQARLNDLEQAEEAYRQALAINEKGHEALAAQADVAYRRCNLSRAVQAVQAALALQPDNTVYLGRLATLYEAQGRDEDAFAQYEKLLSAPDSDVVAHLTAAEHLFRTGELEGAAETLERLLAAGSLPAFQEGLAHNLLGDVYLAQGRTLPAQGEYELALQTLPILYAAQASLGDIRLMDGDPEAALQLYDRAVRQLPGFQTFLSLDNAILGEVFLDLRQAIAYQKLGDARMVASMREAALARAQRLLDTLPRAPLSHFTWGLVQSELGNRDAAEEAFSLALQCDASMGGARTQVEARLAMLRESLNMDRQR